MSYRLVKCPGVGIIPVVRLTRHFGVNTGSGDKTWNVTHLPSGFAAIRSVSFVDAVEAATAFETCGTDWDFADVKAFQPVLAKPIREQFLARGA